MIIVADTGPINYLILSGYIHLVHQLYGSLLLPQAVRQELLHPKAPSAVRDFAMNMPPWAEVRAPKDASGFSELGPGEREAISLAIETRADYLLIDETLGRSLAVTHGVRVKGILAVLEDADAQQLLDLPLAIEKLRTTTIFLSDDVVNSVLARRRSRSK